VNGWLVPPTIRSVSWARTSTLSASGDAYGDEPRQRAKAHDASNLGPKGRLPYIWLTEFQSSVARCWHDTRVKMRRLQYANVDASASLR